VKKKKPTYNALMDGLKKLGEEKDEVDPGRTFTDNAYVSFHNETVEVKRAGFGWLPYTSILTGEDKDNIYLAFTAGGVMTIPKQAVEDIKINESVGKG